MLLNRPIVPIHIPTCGSIVPQYVGDVRLICAVGLLQNKAIHMGCMLPRTPLYLPRRCWTGICFLIAWRLSSTRSVAMCVRTLERGFSMEWSEKSLIIVPCPPQTNGIHIQSNRRNAKEAYVHCNTYIGQYAHIFLLMLTKCVSIFSVVLVSSSLSVERFVT